MPFPATSRKIFVSYKYKDRNVQPLSGYIPTADTDYLYTPRHYVDRIVDLIGVDHIYKGELSGEDASHLADDTIDSKLKEKIFDSSVTIVLISPNMWDKSAHEKYQWIPNEISYSLRDKRRGDRMSVTNGMLAVVVPDINGSYQYAVVDKPCGVREWQTVSFFRILNSNMFNRKEKRQTLCKACWGYHHHGNDHSYIFPIKWCDFIASHNSFIEHALTLRDQLSDFDLAKTHE